MNSNYDFHKTADKIVKECLKVEKGEKFWISCCGAAYMDFCEAVAMSAIEVGAYPVITLTTDGIHEKRMEQKIDYLKQASPYPEALVECSQVQLHVLHPKVPNPHSKETPEKLSAAAVSSKEVMEKIYQKNSKEVNFRQASFLYPTPESAQYYKIPYEELSSIIWGAVNIDYPQLQKRAKTIAKLMSNTDKVYIKNYQGSDLSFSIKNRMPFIDDGIFDEDDKINRVYMNNFPAGEVCIAPIENSAEGKAVFSFNRYNGKDLKNISLDFSKGRIVSIEGDEGADYYKSILAGHTGDKDQIAELGIGLNPCITKVLGELALDEKIIGTIHIATGDNRMIHGQGVSSFHWDLVMEKPTMFFDDKIIMEEGEYRV